MGIRYLFEHFRALRGFIQNKGNSKYFGFFSVVFCVLVSFLVIFINSFFFNGDFEVQRFEKGGVMDVVQDPTISGSVVWGYSQTESKEPQNESFVSGSSQPSTNIGTARDGIKTYKVQKGETLRGIASKFSLSLETIKLSNPQIKKEVKRGDIITILPTNGLLYSVKPSDSIVSISEKYEVSQSLIKQFNPTYISIFSEGAGIIFLPYATAKEKDVLVKNLPDVGNFFSLPAVGWNWGELHKDNAVDIANKCGTEVVASADGVVIKDEVFGDGSSGWNGGYGVFALLEHTNGTKTRYAHLEKSFVDIGDVVSRGQKIGVMGSTGNAESVNGCHVHFEIVSAKNPFILR
ncbi:MAG: peptidase M23 family protein [Parcubacteria group bacterium LiPW_41]|nr:MAG: peptidase M23 family protein [Parcubacteria group bacterium LiPW_41]